MDERRLRLQSDAAVNAASNCLPNGSSSNKQQQRQQAPHCQSVCGRSDLHGVLCERLLVNSLLLATLRFVPRFNEILSCFASFCRFSFNSLTFDLAVDCFVD